MKKSLHAFFGGNVQGVGFRYTARNLARAISVAGWVKNLKDGRVELCVEGEEMQIESFLKELKKRMERNIQTVETEWSAPSGKFSVFEITY